MSKFCDSACAVFCTELAELTKQHRNCKVLQVLFSNIGARGQHCLKINKIMAEYLLRAQPDSVANHVTDRSISDRRALM